MSVKVYTMPKCPWCKKLKDWLNENKFKFEELDIFEENKYRDEMIEKTHQGAVPVIDVNGKLFVGFHEKELRKAIEAA